MEDIDSRIAALKAVAHDWSSKKSTQASQINYISILRLLTEDVSSVTTSRQVLAGVASGIYTRLADLAVEHAQTGVMSWLVILGWDNILQTVLGYVPDKRIFSPCTTTLWKTVLKLAKEGSYNTNSPSTNALAACLYLAATFFQYSPIEVKVLRRQLPHPVKCVSVLVRNNSFQLLPYIVLNMSNRSLNLDLLEYLKRGFECTDPSVQRSAVVAIREMLQHGIVMEETQKSTLLALLWKYCNVEETLPEPVLQDVGLALGCLFELYQCELTYYPQEPLARWTYPAGANPQQARRVLTPLFTPPIVPNVGRATAIAFSQLLLRCAPPAQMEEAIHSLFILMLSVPEQNRSLFSRILVEAFKSWVGNMPTNAHRIAFLVHIRDYLGGTQENLLVPKTAVVIMCRVAPMLFSGREIDFVDDFLSLVEAHPSLMVLIGETIAAFTTHSPIFLRRILRGLTEQCAFYVDNMLQAIPLELVICGRALECFEVEILALPAVRQALLKGTFTFDISEKPNLDEGSSPAKYTEIEFFFLFSRILFEYHSEDLSDFVIDKINTSVSTLLAQLVSAPVLTNAYRRAAAAACKLLSVRGNINNVERTLCMGLLEGQLVRSKPAEDDGGDNNYEVVLLAQLKEQVYRMTTSSDWAPGESGVDEATIKWLVSQAMHDVEQLCEEKIPIFMTDEEIFPVCATRIISPLRRLVGSTSQKDRSREGLQAAELIGWGLFYFGASNESFCFSLLSRLDALYESAANDDTRRWNAFLVIYRILLPMTAPGVEHDVVASRVAAFSPQLCMWSRRVQEGTCPPSQPLELDLLIARVGGCLLKLTDQVDYYTSTVLRDAQNKKHSDADTCAVVLLLCEAHACQAGRSSTLPLATSYLADIIRRVGLFGDPCPPPIIPLFIGYLRLIESTEFNVDAVLQVLNAALVVPIQKPVNHLSFRLLFLFVSQIRTSMLDSTKNKDFLLDFEQIVLRFALSDRASLTSVYVNDGVMDLVVKSVRDFCLYAESEQIARAQLCGAHALVRLTVNRPIHYSVSESLGRLWISTITGIEHHFTDLLHLSVQCIARRMDAATSYPCREVWNTVATMLVTHSLDTMLSSIKEIYAVLQAKTPNTIVKGKKKGGNENSSARAPHGSEAENGEENVRDEENWEGGREGILSTSKSGQDKVVMSDIASKVMMLDLLDAALYLTHESKTMDAREKEKSRKVLEAIVSAIPQVETMPELVGPAIQLMREVLEKFGWEMVETGNPKQPKVPFLLPHKSQITASLKTLLQLSLLHIADACRLFEVFLYCNLADDTTVRRVLRGFFLFILVIERLEEDDEAATISGESGPVILSLTRAIHRAKTENWTETYTAALDFLVSESSQETLALICNQHITTKALMNGCLPPFNQNTLSEANFYNDCGTVEEVMEAAAQISRGGHLGLTLRYSVGCLSCLALTDPEETVDCIPYFMSDLTSAHQKVLVNVAHRELKTGRSDQSDLLVDIILASSIPLNRAIIQNVATTVLSSSPLPPVKRVGGLLNGALETNSPVKMVCACLSLLPVDFMRAAPLTVELMTTYIKPLPPDSVEEIYTGSPSGFVLLERITHRLWYSEKIGAVEALLLKEALEATSDPVAITEFMCNTKRRRFDFYKILFSIVISFDETDQELIVKCERLLCMAFLSCFEAVDGTEPSSEAVEQGLQLLVFAVEEAPLKDLLRILLQSAGALLTNVLTPKYPHQLRNGIQQLGTEKALQLRNFMERSTSGQ